MSNGDLPHAGAPSKYDEEDPYEGEDLSTYPAWWRKNIRRFESHDFRPYRPPRFSDGVLVPPTVHELEADYSITISIRATNPQRGTAWAVLVDDDSVMTVPKTRHRDGYNLYDVSSAEFCAAVENAVRD